MAKHGRERPLVAGICKVTRISGMRAAVSPPESLVERNSKWQICGNVRMVATNHQ
jgi:hypothetical protein